MNAIKRLLQYIEYKGISPAYFEKQTGLANGYIAKTAKRDGRIGEEIFQKIIDNCPDISPLWLLLGSGEMLKKDSLETPLDAKEN